MSEVRLADYLDHIQKAASDARSFVEGLSKENFLDDTRTRQAVIMSLVIIGEAATKIMERHPRLSPHATRKYLGEACAVCATASLTATST